MPLPVWCLVLAGLLVGKEKWEVGEGELDRNLHLGCQPISC